MKLKNIIRYKKGPQLCCNIAGDERAMTFVPTSKLLQYSRKNKYKQYKMKIEYRQRRRFCLFLFFKRRGVEKYGRG